LGQAPSQLSRQQDRHVLRSGRTHCCQSYNSRTRSQGNSQVEDHSHTVSAGLFGLLGRFLGRAQPGQTSLHCQAFSMRC
jgi:hypothetical protein